MIDELGMDYKKIKNDIIDFKTQFDHSKKMFDEKLRNIKQSINSDNDLFIDNFDKIT